ncbi:MFS general substrate transporter [Glonium stellatum]|uniref:MFS general substrate transporter n=1 Tax=Glonium stellatum TaxID=574774 RepID=A0A8E2EQB3_9PEZI|nr:MFS general substrate transporter [Glonium stellatum]
MEKTIITEKTTVISAKSKHRPPVLLRYRSSTRFIISVVALACFVDVFLYGLAVPVLPFALHKRVNIATDHVQYWISVLLGIYGAGVVVGSPIAGWLADQLPSRRVPLLVGLITLLGTTLLLCLSRTIHLFVLGRILQGLTAAIVWTVGLALLSDTVGQDRVGKAMGYVSMALPLASLCAPVLGGLLFDHRGYYAVFAIAFATIGLDILFRLVMIEKSAAAEWSDVQADALEVTPRAVEEQSRPVSSMMDEHLSTGKVRTESPRPVGIEKGDASKPLRRIPPVLLLLKSPRLLAALWGTMMEQTLTTAFDAVLPLFVKETFGWDATKAGLIFLPYMCPFILLSPVVGSLSDKWGSRALAAAGFISGCPFLICLRFVTHSSSTQIAILCILLLLNGISGALTLPSLMAEVSRVVETKEAEDPRFVSKSGAYAQAYGLFVSFQGLGCTIGPLIAGALRQGCGWETMATVLGILCGVSAIPVLLFTD